MLRVREPPHGHPRVRPVRHNGPVPTEGTSIPRSKNLRTPDESIEFPLVREDLVDVGELTVGRTVQEPGWRWSSHVQPHVGGEWCEAHHMGFVVSGHWGVTMRDGGTLEFGPDDVYDVPPGHDGYTIGEEPAVMLEWSGLRSFARRHLGFSGRMLSTLLFTDLVGSTTTAVRLGDVAWREALSRHYQALRSVLERFRGREIATTGDGLLAVFDAPATALQCAAAIRKVAHDGGFPVRIGVHVGEVELVGADVRGVAVHEAARIMSAASADEILLSEITRALAGRVGLAFEDRGPHDFKGLPEPIHLFAYEDSPLSEEVPS